MGTVSKITAGFRKFLDSTLNIYIYSILFIILIITAYPFWYIFIQSISNPAELTANIPLIPKGITFYAYRVTIESPYVLSSFFVSVARSTIAPLYSTTISLLVAYALSKRDLPGRKTIVIIFLLTMYFEAGLIPRYVLIKSLGLTNNFLVYILPKAMNVYGMILMRTYIESLPKEMEECAYIDGAKETTIFSKIIVPLCKPVIAAIVLLTCVANWNNYTDTLIFNTTNEKLYTLQYVLVTFVKTISVSAQSQSEIVSTVTERTDAIVLTPMIVRMAMTVITVVPISLVYPFLQKYFIKGIMIGAVKG